MTVLQYDRTIHLYDELTVNRTNSAFSGNVRHSSTKVGFFSVDKWARCSDWLNVSDRSVVSSWVIVSTCIESVPHRENICMSIKNAHHVTFYIYTYNILCTVKKGCICSWFDIFTITCMICRNNTHFIYIPDIIPGMSCPIVELYKAMSSGGNSSNLKRAFPSVSVNPINTIKPVTFITNPEIICKSKDVISAVFSFPLYHLQTYIYKVIN